MQNNLESGTEPVRSSEAVKSRRLLLALLVLVVCGVSLFVGVSYSNYIRPAGIIIHHSAIPLPLEHSQLDVKLIDEFHRKRGFSIFYWGRFYHIGYHYIILPDGTVLEGRPEHCRGAHAEGYNTYVGICLIGNFSSMTQATGTEGPTQTTAAQFEALAKLCRHLQEKYNIPLERIRRHHDVNSNTECPGDRFPFVELLRVLKNSG